MATAMPSPSIGSTIIPGMRYSNAPAAIEWLCNAFGFEKHLVVPGDNNTIAHAQLTFGGGMMMLGSVRDNDPRFPLKQPKKWAAQKRNSLTSSSPTVTRITPAPNPPVLKSSLIFTTRATVAAATPAAISKITSGTSAHTILGRFRSAARKPCELVLFRFYSKFFSPAE